MSEPTPHLGDEIQDLLDGRLDPAREAVVRAHLAACDVCRQEWQRLDWLKTRLRALSETATVPAGLEPAIRAALDREPAEWPVEAVAREAPIAAPPSPPRRAPRVRWTIAAGLAALLVVMVGGGVWWWVRPPAPAEIAADYLALAERRLRIDHATPDARALERYFAAQGGVPARVYDLGMMRYTLAGGRVQPHRAHTGTLAVYEGERGERVICEMYFAPPPSHAPIDRRTHNGIDFTVYRVSGVVIVFWDEGPVTCVLAAIMDPEALVQLAFAKAMPPA